MKSLEELHATMALIRAFETRVTELYREGEIPGFVHTSLGQEASAAGVCGALREDDYMSTTHRGHGHVLAKGTDLDGMMAELFAKVTGLCRGKGGSMHVADPGRAILGANAIVGAGIPIAVGAGLSIRTLKQDRVSVGFFGEGAVNQGAFHEAVNLAAIWDLPVLFACENNVYAEFTDSRTMTRAETVAERGAAYGLRTATVDGNDAEAVHAAALEALEHCRGGRGPVFLEIQTYRMHGHYEGDQITYVPADERDGWLQRDPLVVAEARLQGVDAEAVRADALRRVDEAIATARAAEGPPWEEVFDHVFV